MRRVFASARKVGNSRRRNRASCAYTTRRRAMQAIDTFNPAVFKERCQAHGDDPSRAFRDDTAKSLEEMHNALSTMRRNPTRNAAQIEIDAADMVRKQATDRHVLFDVKRNGLLQRQEAIQNEVEATMQPPRAAWAALAPELRTMLRGMPEAERYRLLNAAQGTDDYLPLLYAVAGAPCALSGVAAGKHAEMRNTVLGLRNPKLLSQPAQLKRELVLLDKCEQGFQRSIAEFVDFARADALKQLATGVA
jgi:hypothetical protein